MTQHDYLWNPREPRDHTIAELERALAPLKNLDVSSTSSIAGRIRPKAGIALSRVVLPAIAAASILILLSVVATYGSAMRPWAVATIPVEGSFAADVPQVRTVRPGDVITTDSISSARLNVGLIGRTRFEPGSRVRVLNASASEYRLALEKGVMHARIWAPPRFFLVETKNAIAIDLGCAYTMRANADGSIWMRVESGEVELAGANARVRIPAGNSASVHADGSSGLPVPNNASDRLVKAVNAFDQNASNESVDSILEAADSSATIVLWHLLSRVSEVDRGRIFDRLSSLADISKVDRADVVTLDSHALEKLRGILAPSWSTEIVPVWKRLWRSAFSLARS